MADIMAKQTTKKNIAMPLILGIGGGLIVVGVTVGFLMFSGSARHKIAKNFNSGIKFLNEMNYDEAVASFQTVLEIDPYNFEAMQGLMNAAKEAGNDELVAKTVLDALVRANENPDFLGDHRADLVRIAASIDCDEDMEKKIVEELSKAYQGSGDDDIGKGIVWIISRKAGRSAKAKDPEGAIEALRNMLDIDRDNEAAKAELEKLVRNYVYILKRKQQYDKALQYIEIVREYCGPEALAEEKALIESAKAQGDDIDGKLVTISAAFDADDIDRLKLLLSPDQWRNYTDTIQSIFFSRDLLKNGKANGFGIGIYLVRGSVYAYYGNYVDGLRNGEGTWYYVDDRGTLTKIFMTWVNDLPQGRAKYETYQTIDIYGYGGVYEYSKDSVAVVDVNLVNGVYDGKVSKSVTCSDGDAYDMVTNYNNGYGVILRDGEYDSDIDNYSPGGKAVIIGYAYGRSGSTYWQNYNPTRATIAGIGSVYDRPGLCTPVRRDIAL